MPVVALPNPDEYRFKINDLGGQFSVKMDGIVDAYINTKLNPTNTEYRTIYDGKMTSINAIQSSLFEIENKVSTASENARTEIQTITTEIEENKARETSLKGRVNGLAEIDSGAAGARKVMTDLYKLQYASNFFLLIGIILGAIVIFKMFAGAGDGMGAPEYGTG